VVPSASTAVVGVIGDPVGHSLSPGLHNAAFEALDLDWVSLAFPVPEGRVASAVAAVRDLGIRGLSVTMPHKTAAAAGADELTPVAARLGAVNCLARMGDRVLGDNTDGAGFLAALDRGLAWAPGGHRCLVAGAGGAARAVVLALAAAGAEEVAVVNRTRARAADAATLAGLAGRTLDPADVPAAVERMDLVVDATPVAMAGSSAQRARALVPADLLHPGQLAVDLVYHPVETAWVQAARARGVRAQGGLGLLVHQAALQLERWTGVTPPVAAMWAAVTSSPPSTR